MDFETTKNITGIPFVPLKFVLHAGRCWTGPLTGQNLDDYSTTAARRGSIVSTWFGADQRQEARQGGSLPQPSCIEDSLTKDNSWHNNHAA
jgi:hypothetical protein